MGKKSRRSERFIGGLMVLLVAVLLAACGGGAAPVPPTVPATQAPTQPPVSGAVEIISVREGFGARKGFWEVYFTNPRGLPANQWSGGIDEVIAESIRGARGTVDIAAFELDSPAITSALVDAHTRGVRVRMVTDNEHGIGAARSTVPQLLSVNIPVVDDNRSGLMHNKFIIIDSQIVWTGALNYTGTGTFTNNNNALMLRSRRAVEAFQQEFEEMFTQREFGSSRSASSAVAFVQDGIPVRIVFAPEDNVDDVIIEELSRATSSIRFMAFSFTLSNVRDEVLAAAGRGVDVAGVVETRQSTESFAALPTLFCNGVDVRQDGNSGPLHHKVFIIDNETVLTGSFNFSASATNNNDENMVIIRDPDLAAQYLAEFERVQAIATYPEGVSCDVPGRQPTPRPTTAVTCPSLQATCSQLTCEQAYACLAAGNTRLDGDGDGIPCASVCR